MNLSNLKTGEHFLECVKCNKFNAVQVKIISKFGCMKEETYNLGEFASFSDKNKSQIYEYLEGNAYFVFRYYGFHDNKHCFDILKFEKDEVYLDDRFIFYNIYTKKFEINGRTIEEFTRQ